MYKVIIADDEKLARNRLRKLLSEFSEFEIIAEASDGVMALELTQKYKPDFIFLDIEMPGLNGLEVAKKLGISKTKIIFVTGYDEFALEAFESNTVDYLVKPIKKERLLSTYNKLVNKEESKLHVKIGDRIKLIELDHIYYIKSEGAYSRINSSLGSFLCNDNLETLLTKVASKKFIRIHRGTILNLIHLKELKRIGDRKYEAYLCDGEIETTLKISRSCIANLKELLMIV